MRDIKTTLFEWTSATKTTCSIAQSETYVLRQVSYRIFAEFPPKTDGTTLLERRVGGILKKGLELGGRYFEFLAYSSSALREHAVWFVHPFHHTERGYINGERIRQSLGDFSGVINQPSKYAARMAQAFTATDPSVEIRRYQWEEINDLGTGSYLHTDGVGTVSPQLASMIWEALCVARNEDPNKSIKPHAVGGVVK